MIQKISLIICTRNRAAQLQPCLDSLLALEAPCEWELIVIDNGSTDATAAVVGRFAEKAPFPVRCIPEPLPGLSRARNRGLAAASGDAILFTDDDCYPEPDYFHAAVGVLTLPEMDYFGGRVLLHDPSDAPVTIKTSTEIQVLPPRSLLHPGVIHGANMGFHRRVVVKIGGFNEGLGAGSSLPGGDDIEYLARASAAGFQGGYFPGPTVRHHHRRKQADVPSLTWGYHLGRGGYYASMILHTDSTRQFTRGLLRTLTWRHPRLAIGIICGTIKFGMVYLLARIAGRTLIPRTGQP